MGFFHYVTSHKTIVKMNAIQFDEKNKSAELTYQQLAQTMEIGNAKGEMPKACPVQPGTLITDMCSAVQKYTGLEATVSPIVIREPYCNVNRQKLNRNEELQLEDYLIRRLVTRIDIPMLGFKGTADAMNASIGISYIYTDGAKGIQVGFGENVNVCENLTVFGGFTFSTYGNSRVSFEDGMQLMNHWLQNLQSLHDQHLEIIGKLMAAKVARPGFQRIVGSLFEKAVRVNAGSKEILAPMNQTQIAAMVAQGAEVLDSEVETLNGWQIMNWGTSILKPHNSDMVDVIKDTSNFNSFLLNEFKIPHAITI
jgi:hypothetical protein